MDSQASAVTVDASALDVSVEDAPAADKNYGEAQLVSVGEPTGEKFFKQARLARTKARDEALDVLQKALKKAKLEDEEKARLTEQLSKTVEHIAAESEIESLIKAKGFVDCVAFLDNDKAQITVMTTNDGLKGQEVAQIRDIVLNKCKLTAKDITVVEVK